MPDTLNLLPEWTAQDAVLLAWPHANSDWAPFLPRIESVYGEIIYHITRFEHVVVLCETQELADAVHNKLTARQINMQRVHFQIVPYNDTWLRDSGPITVADSKQIRTCDFRFNGWGGKFDATLDDQICQTLSQLPLFKAQYKHFTLTLEGGSLDTDGNGTLLTTSQCLLTDTRNPKMQKSDYEHFFAQEFGIKRVLWLDEGELEGDDTDGHIDMLARFCDPTTIAYTTCERKDDAHFSSLAAMETELKHLRTTDGHPYNLVPLPIPAAIHNQEGRRLPASYANFLIINDAVLVPIYEDTNDKIVLQRLQHCFPGREIIGINARAIIEQFGSLHCLTMQLPRGVLNLAN